MAKKNNAPTSEHSPQPTTPLRRRLAGTLRARLMLATMVPITALLIALVLVGIMAFTGLTQTLVEERDSELVQLAAKQVATYWADSVLILNQISTFDEVRRGDLPSSQERLTRYEPILRYFDQVSITDPNGKVLVTQGGVVGELYGGLAAFERARRLRRPVRSNLYREAGGQATDVVDGAVTAGSNAAIVVAVPIYDPVGQFAGCVLGVWNVGQNRLGQPVDSVRVGESGYAYLVDADGIVLFHPDKTWAGADYRADPAVAALLRGEIGTQTLISEGERVVYGYAPIPLRHLTGSLMADETWDGWGLVTVEKWQDIVAPIQPYVQLITLLLVLVVTLPLVILAFSSRRIVAPLQSLVAQTERVASGELESQVSINAGPTEVRELEVAFNAMVQQLRRSRLAIQSYVVSVLNGQEDERKRVARELHDDTAQTLIVLGREIELAAEQSSQLALRAKLEQLRNMVDDALQGVRRFTSDLRPPLLAELGLPRSLQILGSRIEREGAQRVKVTIAGEPRLLLPEFELALYRLAQESLSNVRRHAQASDVELRLAYELERVTLEVTDNGVGFAAPADWEALTKQGQLGLMGIHERARLFGGKATITSTPGHGTAVTIDVPLTSIVLPATEGDIAEQPTPETTDNPHI